MNKRLLIRAAAMRRGRDHAGKYVVTGVFTYVFNTAE